MAANEARLTFIANTLSNAATTSRGLWSMEAATKFPAPPNAGKRSRFRPFPSLALFPRGDHLFLRRYKCKRKNGEK